MTRVLRTPESRFTDLEGYGFEAHYAEVFADDGPPLLMHYLDEGPRQGRCVLLLHGEPTWSYLYRRIIPPLVTAGYRCVAPDLIGFGKSDKPATRTDHTYARHVAWVGALVRRLVLSAVTLFGHDWGGLVGLRLVAAEPDGFARVAISNTGLPTGGEDVPEAFLRWRRQASTAETLPVGRAVAAACARPLSAAAIAAYDAPFPDEAFKAGPRVLPTLVPISVDDPAHDDNLVAWDVLRALDCPFLCAFSDQDPFTADEAKRFVATVPGARSRVHPVIVGAGHFVQEDRPDELVRVLLDFLSTT